MVISMFPGRVSNMIPLSSFRVQQMAALPFPHLLQSVIYHFRQFKGSIPVVGPDGTVYVAWYNFNQDSIRLNKSTNGGSSFGTPRLVANISSIPSPLPGGEFRTYSFPTMAVDQNTGYVYVAWSDFQNNDADIYFTRSIDGGATWSTPVRVNDDTKYNDAHQFFPWMDVSPNGSLFIGWFDSRLDPTPNTIPHGSRGSAGSRACGRRSRRRPRCRTC